MQIFCLLNDVNIVKDIKNNFDYEYDIWAVNSVEHLLRISKTENDVNIYDKVILTDISKKEVIENINIGCKVLYFGQDINYDNYITVLPLLVNNLAKNYIDENKINNLLNCLKNNNDIDYYLKLQPSNNFIIDNHDKYLMISSEKYLLECEIAKYIAIHRKKAYEIIDASNYSDIELLEKLFGKADTENAINGLCHQKDMVIIIENCEQLPLVVKRKIYNLILTKKFTRVDGRYNNISDVDFIFLTHLPLDDNSGVLYLLKSNSQSFSLTPISEWLPEHKLMLFMYYIQKYYKQKQILSFSKEVTEYLSDYRCENNILEIQEISSYIVRHIGVSKTIQMKHIPSNVIAEVTTDNHIILNENLRLITDYNIFNSRDVERILLVGAFKASGYIHSKACKIYGVSSNTWYKRIRKNNIDIEAIKRGENVLADIIRKYQKLNEE